MGWQRRAAVDCWVVMASSGNAGGELCGAVAAVGRQSGSFMYAGGSGWRRATKRGEVERADWEARSTHHSRWRAVDNQIYRSRQWSGSQDLMLGGEGPAAGVHLRSPAVTSLADKVAGGGGKVGLVSTRSLRKKRMLTSNARSRMTKKATRAGAVTVVRRGR